MANLEHVAKLLQGTEAWNKWRRDNPDVRPDLSEAKLPRASMREADLRGANFARANLWGADLIGANLSAAELSNVQLAQAGLIAANLTNANLTRANLTGARLDGASLVCSTLKGADLTGCHIFGTSVWDVDLEDTVQENLIIMHSGSRITVDNLALGQFIYLLLENERIREVVDAIISKFVLILGRFTEERMKVLEALREALRAQGFVPILFCFERPRQRDFTETIRLLVGLSSFVIADITDPLCIPLELQAIVEGNMVPVVPIIQNGEEPFAMFRDLMNRSWVLDLFKYDSAGSLTARIKETIIEPAILKREELTALKAKPLRVRHV